MGALDRNKNEELRSHGMTMERTKRDTEREAVGTWELGVVGTVVIQLG